MLEHATEIGRLVTAKIADTEEFYETSQNEENIKPGLVTHTCNLSTWKAEAGKSP